MTNHVRGFSVGAKTVTMFVMDKITKNLPRDTFLYLLAIITLIVTRTIDPELYPPVNIKNPNI